MNIIATLGTCSTPGQPLEAAMPASVESRPSKTEIPLEAAVPEVLEAKKHCKQNWKKEKGKKGLGFFSSVVIPMNIILCQKMGYLPWRLDIIYKCCQTT
jgi:hypothetical protein